MSRLGYFLIYSLSFFIGLILFLLLINQNKIEVFENTNTLIKTNSRDETSLLAVRSIAVIGDTHLSTTNFNKLKESFSKHRPSLLIHLGDHTDYGEIDKLQLAKQLIENLDISFVVLPGDRDLGASGGRSNFYQVFPLTREYDFYRVKLLFIDNSPNFTPLSSEDLDYYLHKIPETDLVFMSQPILTEKGALFSEKYMGSLEDEDFIKYHVNEVKKYHQQKDQILEAIRQSKTKYVISADHHYSNTFLDSYRNDLTFHQVGSLSDNIQFGDLTLSQKSLQPNKYTLLKFYENNQIQIEEIILD